MASLSTMTGAGGMITLAGKSYVATHLSIGDMAQIQEWLKQRIPGSWSLLKDALLALQGLPEKELAACRNILVPSAHSDAKAGEIDLRSKEAQTQLASTEGMSLMVWLSIRRNQPNVAYEQIHTDLMNASPEEGETVVREMSRIVKASLGAEEVEKMQSENTITNPTQPPVAISPLPAEQTGFAVANQIGGDFFSTSSKTSKSFPKKFPR